MDELMEILEDVRPDIDFSSETKLIDNGVLDSFDIIAIVNECNEKFDIEITVASLLPENFNSAEAIWTLVQKLQNE
jgi:D-alanine--poly(phosphoribitol) ligase subunit 2